MTQKYSAAAYIISITGAIVIAGACLYGAYWLAKTISYSLFYKDMVSATVTEIVKEECLK